MGTNWWGTRSRAGAAWLILALCSGCEDEQEAPKVETPDASVQDAGSAACDMAGVWALRWTSIASGAVVAVSNNWFYLEIAQEGEELTVTDSVDCGYTSVIGTLSAYSPPALEDVLPQYNSQVGRKGSLRSSGASCDFFLKKFWTVRGADVPSYLPDGPFAETTLAAVQAKAPLPTAERPEGAEDWDNDGKPGITLVVTDLGERYSTNRDWTEFFSCNGTSADPAACRAKDTPRFGLVPEALLDTFTVRSDYEGEDPPIEATSAILLNDAPAVRDADNRGTFKRLGSGRDDGLAKAFWAPSEPHARCDVLRGWLPPEGQ